jgi:putative Mn2+ efflux pump MntP
MTLENQKSPMLVYLVCFLTVFFMFAVFGSLIGFVIKSFGYDVNYAHGALSIGMGSLLVWAFMVKQIRTSNNNHPVEQT